LEGEHAPDALPSMGSAAACGFPSPADDYVEGFLSLDGFLGVSLEGVRLLCVDGNAWHTLGVQAGDVLVVETSRAPMRGAWVLAEQAGGWSIVRDGVPPEANTTVFEAEVLTQAGEVVGLIRLLA